MKIKNYIFVFDLDDTLYSECEYQNSGINAVEEMISNLFNVSFKNKIKNAYKNGVKDLWAWTCKELDLPLSVKETLLWTYRLHDPKIQLQSDVNFLLDFLRKEKANVAIITDGRSISQRIKLKKLGLSYLPIYISEDYLSIKPNLLRFKKIEEKWPNKKYIYIGDNPKKDFKAPNELGWITIGAKWINPRIYSSDSKKNGYQPNIWIDKPTELIDYISKNLF